jgi:pimeloyl-ACP methyl ester carboxylesterase
MCSGLNLPFGSHHSAAIASNLATSAGRRYLSSHGLPVLSTRAVCGGVYRAMMDQHIRAKARSAPLSRRSSPSTVTGSRWAMAMGLCRAMRQSRTAAGRGPAWRPRRRLQPAMRRFFDPAHYRIVLFDQRGCGRSRPHASVDRQHHLAPDRRYRAIRETLGIDRFIVFGGSWGATLALAYAQTHPDRVAPSDPARRLPDDPGRAGLVLRRRRGAFLPRPLGPLLRPHPPEERGDLIAAYHRRLFSGNLVEETRFGRIWANWENALASIQNEGALGESPSDYARAFARLERRPAPPAPSPRYAGHPAPRRGTSPRGWPGR